MAAMTFWLLPLNMPLERHAELRPASQAALHLLGTFAACHVSEHVCRCAGAVFSFTRLRV